MSVEVISYDRIELVSAKSVTDFLHPNRRNYRVVLDGKEHACEVGAWAVWIPILRAKYLHSVDGLVTCIHKDAPTRGRVSSKEDGQTLVGRYTLDEWRAAYSKPARERAAEIAACTVLLHRAGLGPELIGMCRASTVVFDGQVDKSGAYGIVTEDARTLPPKRDATEVEVIAAGVRPDRILSCVRQQVNGYVVDLNSAVGALPEAGTEEVRQFVTLLS